MDRRLFLTGLFGVAGAAVLASLPKQAGAATGDPLEELRPPRLDGMPEWEIAEKPVEEGEQYAVSNGSGNTPVWRRRHHRHHRRYNRRWRGRRRRRYRRWRRNCYWRYGRRICRRRAVWLWGFF
jgi:hypothetical protein